ncbi:CLUMA_CG002039, isoform A, partial [Clunio marinus]
FIHRLCSLTITRLSLLTALPADLSTLSLAVKMQSSKRTLRSHEIPVPQLTIPSYIGGGIQLNSPPLLETELDLHFSLQYPHFLKRDGNRLLILLQRRKKYKTRTILGYKTLAEGVIRMDAVLQKSMDMTVELSDAGKNGRPGFPIATIRATQVSSSPVDQDNKNNNSVLISDRGIGNEYSDEDEYFSSNEDNDDGLSGYAAKRNYASKRDNYRKLERNENDAEADENLGGAQGDSDSDFEVKVKGSRANKMSRQRNFKQKIVALLKRFRPEELEGEVRRGQGVLRGERDLDALFQELESLSCGEGEESGQDIDSISIGSTPKPSLRPFFNSKQENILDKMPVEKRDSIISDKKISPNGQDRTGDSWRADSSGNEGTAHNTDPEAPNSDPQQTTSSPKDAAQTSGDKRKTIFRTTSNAPTSATKKKQSLSFTSETKSVPLDACLSPTNVEPRKSLLEQLSRSFATDESSLPEVVSIIGPTEPGNHFIHRLVTLLSTNIKPMFQAHNTAEIKAILQSLMTKIQKYCNSTAKPPSTIKVLLLGGDWLQGSVLRHYVELLGCRPPDWLNHIRFFIVPIGNSAISRYLSSIDNSYATLFGNESWQQLCSNSDNSQTKADGLEITNRIQRYLHSSGPCTQIPIAEAMVNYKEEDSCQIFVPFISDVRLGNLEGPQLSLDLDESGIGGSTQLSSSPPNTGRVSPTQVSAPAPVQEQMELQVDYWPMLRPIGDGRDKNQTKGMDQGKNSLKSTFRNLQVWRLPLFSQTGEFSNGMTLCFAAKEKKQKIMRLGKKKEKDRDGEKEQCIDGVARLICSAKQSHPVPLRVYIDGTEWTGVKFFQLSSQWQTHVKNFPVALIGAPSSEIS